MKFCLVNSQQSPPELASQAPGGFNQHKMWFKHQKRGLNQHTWWFDHLTIIWWWFNQQAWGFDQQKSGPWLQHYDLYKQQMWEGWSPNKRVFVGFHKVCVPSSGFVTSFPLAPQWATIGQNNAKEYWGYLQILGGQSPSRFFNLQKVNKMELNNQSNIIQPHLISLHWTMRWCSTLWTLRSGHLEFNHPQCDGFQSATLGSNCGWAITMEAQHEQERLKHG